MGTDDRNNLVQVGMLLFGTRWQSDLARALGTSDRMIRYWMSGAHPYPADLDERLIALVLERAGKMNEMVARLKAAAKGKQK